MKNLKRFYEDTYNLPLTRQERDIARLLVERGRATVEDIVLFLYDHGEDEGVDAARVVRVHVSNLRRKLKPAGWTIPRWPQGGVKGRAGQVPAVYEIRRVTDGEQ